MVENKRKVGVALSGGGIRSAAFSSGVLRRLLQKNVPVDYLSCVSGGGYCGAAYLEWKYHHNGVDDPRWHKCFFENMRKRCGIICDWTNPLRGICDTTILISLLCFVVVFIPLINVAAPSFPIAYIVDYFVGEVLRKGFICPDSETKSFNTSMELENNPGLNETFQNISNHNGDNECIAFANEDLYFTYILFIFLALSAALLYITKALLDPKGFLHNKINFLFLVCSISFAFTFTPWLIEEYISVIPKIVSIGLLFFGILLWIGVPFLRDKIFWVILIYVYGYVIKWRVYKTNVLGIEFHDHLFNVALWICAILLWISPYLTALQCVAVETYNRWKLQRAFFYPRTVGRYGCSGISLKDCFPSLPFCNKSYEDVNHKALNLSDLRDIKPEYICNLLVGNWIKDPSSENCESFSLLLVTPNKVERIDCQAEEHTFENRLPREHLKLSDMMATSAAAVSYNMGIYQNKLNTLRDIQLILGISLAKSLVGDLSESNGYKTFLIDYLLPLILQCFIAAPVFLLPIVQMLGYGERCQLALIVIFLFTISCLILIAMMPTGKTNPGITEKIVRWCVIHIQQVRLIRQLSGVMNYGPVPPPVLNLSDGGHVENLGLLPLLKRRCERILVVDGGYTEGDTFRANDWIIAIDFARKWLRCSFSAQDGRDIIEDIKNKFLYKPPGTQPRTYNFKVEYYERPYGVQNDIKIGEGHVLILSPRHPFKGIPHKFFKTWEEDTFDVQQDMDPLLWGPGPDLEASETDELTYCCCECCHCLFCFQCSSFCCGSFPLHATSNQFFTPQMFSAYHREGYRASMDGKIECFLNTDIAWPRDNKILIERLNKVGYKDSSISSSDTE